MTGATDRVADYLRAADLYILPSDYEGFGVGIIEALATGLPSLLTPVGIVPQVVRDGENGFIFRVRDREAMIRAIDTAMAARARWPEIGARARQAVAPMDLDAVVQKYVQLCAETLGGPMFARRPAENEPPAARTHEA
jgi:glycosyltransferase involved in cell wall biosynthesis